MGGSNKTITEWGEGGGGAGGIEVGGSRRKESGRRAGGIPRAGEGNGRTSVLEWGARDGTGRGRPRGLARSGGAGSHSGWGRVRIGEDW